jgi:2,3-bisphosphoglycerate-dependent phosphoglycerate mutase
MQGTLIITRHHETDWNKLGQWQGRTDRHLTDYGKTQAALMGSLIAQVPLSCVYTSTLSRTHETAAAMLSSVHKETLPVISAPAFDERDYGDYTGKNKWEMQKILGDEAFLRLRRGWNEPVPNGETLRDVYERVVPYYMSDIVPRLQRGETVLIVAHGNSLRALTKYIENLSDDAVSSVEFTFGEVITYTFDENGRMIQKVIEQI